jgi:hypothetical protein
MAALPFALAFAAPRQQEQPVPFEYDPAQQLNLCGDGSLAAGSLDVVSLFGATSSTAGSQTHLDD